MVGCSHGWGCLWGFGVLLCACLVSIGGGCVLLLGVGGPREEREGWGHETWGLKVSGEVRKLEKANL